MEIALKGGKIRREVFSSSLNVERSSLNGFFWSLSVVMREFVIVYRSIKKLIPTVLKYIFLETVVILAQYMYFIYHGEMKS